MYLASMWSEKASNSQNPAIGLSPVALLAELQNASAASSLLLFHDLIDRESEHREETHACNTSFQDPQVSIRRRPFAVRCEFTG